MDNDIKFDMECIGRAATIMLVSLVVLGIIMMAVGCDDTPEPTYHYEVYRQSVTGEVTKWTIHEKPWTNEGYLCWHSKNGGKICISGEITLFSILDETIPENQSEAKGKKDD